MVSKLAKGNITFKHPKFFAWMGLRHNEHPGFDVFDISVLEEQQTSRAGKANNITSIANSHGYSLAGHGAVVRGIEFSE